MRFPIFKYVKIKGKWRYKLAVLDRGLPVKDMVVVDGQPEHHPEGAYYIRKDRQWAKAGETPQAVIDTMLRLATDEPETEKIALHTTAMRWLETYNVGKADRTKLAMELVLKNFLLCVQGKAVCIQDVAVDHVRDYWQWEVDRSPTKSYRTAHNRVTSLGKFLKENDRDLIGVGKGKWKIPPFDEEVPEVYEDDEIAALFAACDARHKAAYSVMLKALFRDGEVMHLTWADVDVRRSVLRVRSKPEYGWRVKKHHERDVTVPRDLINLIDALPRTSKLVFPREDGEPDNHLLRYMKDAAVRAGLDPDNCWLHKLRASGCTRLLQRNMPLPDVMKLGGWRDLGSVQRYMGLLNHDRLTAAVEAAWA